MQYYFLDENLFRPDTHTIIRWIWYNSMFWLYIKINPNTTSVLTEDIVYHLERRAGSPVVESDTWPRWFNEKYTHQGAFSINHYNDVIMTTMASQFTSLTVVYSIAYQDADQRQHQSSASLVFVWGIHRWPVNSPHKGPVTRKMFPFDDVVMMAEQGFSHWKNTYKYRHVTLSLTSQHLAQPQIENEPFAYRVICI